MSEKCPECGGNLVFVQKVTEYHDFDLDNDSLNLISLINVCVDEEIGIECGNCGKLYASVNEFVNAKNENGVNKDENKEEEWEWL